MFFGQPALASVCQQSQVLIETCFAAERGELAHSREDRDVSEAQTREENEAAKAEEAPKEVLLTKEDKAAAARERYLARKRKAPS